MSDNVKVIGLEDFDVVEENIIRTLAYEYYDKIKRDAKGLLVIHGKKLNTDGRRCLYRFVVKLEAPNPLVDVQEEDWDLSRALHKVFNKVENAVQKKYKTEGKKRYKKDKSKT